MTKAERYLNEAIGQDYTNLSDSGFMIAVCTVWNRYARRLLVFVKPFLKLKKGWTVGIEAFIILMDSRCKIKD